MKTIICAQFKQETNRYAKGVSGLAEYMQREYVFGEEEIRNLFYGTKSEFGGFFDVLDEEPMCKLVPVCALNASPGPVTAQSIWEEVCNSLVYEIQDTPQVDGILLALHGAMVTEDMEDGEGELLQVLREYVGPNVPIIVTLDLHANVTSKMIEYATALFPCDYYPHTDFYKCGLRAARCIWDTINGKIKPVMRWNKLDLIFPYVMTQSPSFVPLLRKAQSLREMGQLINASICHGFFASDIYDQGAAIVTVADDDPAFAQKMADELAEDVWDARDYLGRSFYTPQEAIDILKQTTEFPVVIADVADNPGSGATTDSVVLLEKLFENNVRDAALAVICDPQTVKQAYEAGIGAEIDVELGGKIAPEITGGPFRCRAVVKTLNDGRVVNSGPMNNGVLMTYGDSAVLQIAGISVIVCSNHTQPYDLEIYRYCGIEPENMKVLIVKSAVHYRASFGPIAAQILDVETPALGPMRPQMLPLAHSRRPIYPLDDCPSG